MQKHTMPLNKNMIFWNTAAHQLPWFTSWHTTLIWQSPHAHWFAGGELNASYACLDIHIERGLSRKTALIWHSEDGTGVSYTYGDLYQKVNAAAQFFKDMGIQKGDRVIIYMPMIPETIITILAIARLGAIHVVVFSGFSSLALRDRIQDVGAEYIVTADYAVRRGKKINLKTIVDQAREGIASIKKVVVIDRMGDHACITHPIDICYHEQNLTNTYIPAVPVESNHPLFVLYTSGTTGKPKGIVHSTGGYLTYCHSTFKQVFDPKESDIYWCTADVGWITGHSYVIYAPLMHGITIFMYEGAPDYPDAGIWWQLIEQYKITTLYTSPTALRMAIKAGDEWPNAYNLSSLKKLGSVGEPINPEVWKWYHAIIGKSRCPIADTWWQTETGGFMIAQPITSPTENKPGSATKPLHGITLAVLDEHGNIVTPYTKGYLVATQPWPGMCIGIYGDPERFKHVYWSKFPGYYYTGDFAYTDEEGDYWLLGRADEVLNIAGHRVGTAEIESAALNHTMIAEVAAIGIADEIRGEQAVLFITLKHGHTNTPSLNEEIRRTVRSHIGAFVVPSQVYYVRQLPKTRSGKIMRRLLKGILDGKSLGDVSTLEDGASLDEIKSIYSSLTKDLRSIIE